jgi:AcrR family transcriptional regulator
MGVGERREREKDLRKKQILAAAKTLLIEKGIQGASLHQIAKRAELGVATIYSYYQNKEAVYAALQEEGLEVLYRKIKQAAKKAKSPPEKIQKMSWAYYRFSETHRDYFDIINYFLSQPRIIFTPDMKHQVDYSGSKILSLVEGVIKEGQEKRIFDKGYAKRSAILLWGTLHGLLHFRKMKDTILKGDSYRLVFEYSVDNFVRSLSCPLSKNRKSKGGQSYG